VHSNLKRRLAIGVVAVAAAAFAGGAYAATKDSNASTRQAFLNDVAKRLHVTPAQLTSALEGAELDQLSAAVASGKLTQAQSNALKQRIQQGHVLLGALGLFRAGPGFMPLFGPGGRLRGNLAPRHFPVPGPPGAFPVPGRPVVPVPFGPAPRLMLPQGGPIASAAGYLGLTGAELFKEMSSGKSLAQIAKARGKSVSGLKAAMVASMKARFDKAVAAKLLTSAQEQRLLDNFSTSLGDLINRSIPRFGFQRPGRGIPWRSTPNGHPPGPASLVPAPLVGPPA
jgi:hypothetical protein